MKNQLISTWILNWLSDYRTDLRKNISEEQILQISEKINSSLESDDIEKESIEDLKYATNGYLFINFSPEMGGLIRNIIDSLNDKYEDVFSLWREMNIYNREVAKINFLCGIQEIAENYLIIDGEEFKFEWEIMDKLNKITKDYINENW